MNDQQQLLKKLSRRTRFTLFLVWIALFFTAAGIAAGYKNWLRIHEKAKAGLAGIAKIQEEIPSFAKKEQVVPLQKAVTQQLKDNKAYVKKSLVELRQIQQSTEHLAESVYKQVEQLTAKQDSSANIKMPSVVSDWSLLDVRFLLQTANQVLLLKQDKQAALQALEMADKRLVEIGSTQLLPLRKQISQDIALLSQYKLPNIAQLSQKISELQQSIATNLAMNLAANNANKKYTKVTTVELPLNQTKDKNSILNRLKQTIKEAVVIRKFDQSLNTEIDAETQQNVSQLLSLKLETLRIMLLQKQDKNFHEQLASIKNILKQYYPESPIERYKKDLDDLDSVNLAPVKPDISASLKRLNKMLLTIKPAINPVIKENK